MGVAILADPSAALRLLAPLDASLLSTSTSSRSVAGNCMISAHYFLPSVRCYATTPQLERKKVSDPDVLPQPSPKSGRVSRSRTLKRSGKKACSRHPPEVAPQKVTFDYDESAVATLEQIYMGSPSFEDAIATASGREDGRLDGGGLRFSVDFDSAVSFPPQSQHRKDKCLNTTSKFPDRILKSASENGGWRKSLAVRLASRRKRPLQGGADREVRSSSAGIGDFSRDPMNVLGSVRVHELLRQYGGNFNLIAQSWFKLRSELLTFEEEQWLASIMKPYKALHKLKARLQKQLSRDPTVEEWARAAKLDLNTLRRFIDVGWAARNKLVQLNLRLVLHQARKYHWEGCSLSVSDLCQEGVQGLMIAVDKFDPTKGFKFCTYAVYWIRNSILRAQTRSGYPIRSPFNIVELKLHIKKMSLELLWELGRAPTVEEIMERAGIDKLRYKTVTRTGRRWVSLHEKQKVTGCELIEYVKDENEDVQSKLGGGAGDAMLRLGIDDVLDSLKPKESLVLRQRFGLDGKGERSLGEIGRNLRMSREMARKYEARGLLKLKHPTRLAYLRSFLPALQSSSA